MPGVPDQEQTIDTPENAGIKDNLEYVDQCIHTDQF